MHRGPFPQWIRKEQVWSGEPYAFPCVDFQFSGKFKVESSVGRQGQGD
jgi:hypothetical protein